MNFQVHDQMYVLHFNTEKERWFLITEKVTGGMKAIPVINDDDASFTPNVVMPIGGEGQASVN